MKIETVYRVSGLDGGTFNTLEEAQHHAAKIEAEIAEKKRIETKMSPLNFTVSSDHLVLMRRLNFVWLINSPSVSCARPYGNGDLVKDVAKIIGLELFEDASGNKHMTAEQEQLCKDRHLEMKTFLEILCQFGEIPSGTYKRKETYHKWEKV